MGRILSHGTIFHMDLSLVVPSFKQAPTIRGDLRRLTKILAAAHITYEIILVIDGDIDGTATLIQQEQDLAHIIVEVLPQNHGKGFALKHGLSLASGAIVGFIDAGGDIDYDCLPIMIELMNFSKADIAIGSKRHPLSVIEYPIIRRIYSLAYQIINRILFRLHTRDTQVGVKLFRREVIETILPYLQIDRFAIDLELLVLARLFQYGHIVESPVRIRRAFRSTINIADALETLEDTIRLYFRERKIALVKPSSGIAISLLSSHAKEKETERTRELVQ